MTMNYYDVLKVSTAASDGELRSAYKRLAMRWHPDKHPNCTKTIAEARFKQICEAYDILSDTNKRNIYDLYGEVGLRSGYYDVTSPPTANQTRSFRRDDDDIFAELFGEVVNERSKSENKDCKGKASSVENKLACSLEELYKGSKRKMKISRIVQDDSGKPRTVEESLGIDIKPGWKKGTKITFPEKGNQESGLLPGDLIFVIEEKPHSTFRRDGNDLVVNQKLTLLEALTGKILNLTTLDGRNLSIEVSNIIKPGHELAIPDEGMPISKEPKKRGNLRIKFDVKFPSRLSADQKADLKIVLSRGS